jgi:hypothetical protein
LKAGTIYNLYRVQVNAPASLLRSEIAAVFANPDHKVKVHKEQHQRGLEVSVVNFHDHVRDVWVEQEGVSTFLMLLVSGAVNPYNVVASIHPQRPGHEFRYPAVRLETVVLQEEGLDDF